MRKSGIHNFPAIDRVVYGKAAADFLKDEAVRLDAKRVFLIVSRTLNTKTDEIEKFVVLLATNTWRPLMELRNIRRASKLPKWPVKLMTQKLI